MTATEQGPEGPSLNAGAIGFFDVRVFVPLAEGS